MEPTLNASVYAARRRTLAAVLPGPTLLLANGDRDRNLPGYGLPFRQDSTFLYFTGCQEPDAALLIDGDAEHLYLVPPAADDALWHGRVLGIEARAAALGFATALPVADLPKLAALQPRTLAIPDAGRNRWASDLLSVPLSFGAHHGDPALVQQVIAMRRHKCDAEIAAHRLAARHTALAFHKTIAATAPGGHERTLAVIFESNLAVRGATPGYGTILTQSGEILHHHGHEQPLQAGRLLLLDGGGEVLSGQGVDITRTWPVSGKFTPQQRAAYGAVLQAQTDAIALCTVGRPYQDVHLAACRTLTRWLVDEGLVTGDVDGAVEQGAHAAFLPHGVGHLLGMDVHDLENFGDLPAYPAGMPRSSQFGLSYLRLKLPLQERWLVTIEPGFYIVPAILADQALRSRLGARVNWSKAESWLGFGGIRIEDDVLITASGPDVLTAAVPKSVAEIEALVGSDLGPARVLA